MVSINEDWITPGSATVHRQRDVEGTQAYITPKIHANEVEFELPEHAFDE
jgi:hypothetical protein